GHWSLRRILGDRPWRQCGRELVNFLRRLWQGNGMEKRRVQPHWQEAHRILRLRAQRRSPGGITRNTLDRCRRTVTTDDTSRVRKDPRGYEVYRQRDRETIGRIN